MKTAEEFRKEENWNEADFWKGEYDIDMNAIDEFAEEYAQKKLKEAAEKIDKIKKPYDNYLYSDGYNEAINDALESIQSLQIKDL